LIRGYWQACRDFYSWRNLVAGAMTKPNWSGRLRHLAYAAGWKKFEGLWHMLIRARQISRGLPLLESVLQGWGGPGSQPVQPAPRPIENTGRLAIDGRQRGHGGEIPDAADGCPLLAEEV
jgi:hypothetical protein